MALESVGLGAVLSFEEGAAVASMGRAHRGLNTLARGANRTSKRISHTARVLNTLGRGLRGIGRAASSAAMAFVPVAAGMAFAQKQAMSFEQAIANVGAVMLKQPSEMAPLIAKAKELGASTRFSASEAAAAMENLARAGFESGEIISGIGGVLSAAAADGMELASAANIVSGAIRGMGLETEKAAGVANVLALTSSKTRTNIAALGENLVYTMAQAKSMNVDFAQLSATLGVVADSLGSTTVGGTSLAQMLVKLSKPSSEGQKLLDEFGFTARYTAAGNLDLARSIEPIVKGLESIEDPMKRARTQAEIFGIRGQKAFAALATGLPKLSKLTADARGQFQKTAGAAQEMAEIRMKTTLGALTILKSALEGLSIEVMGPLLRGFTGWVKTATEGISQVVKGLGLLSRSGGELRAEWDELSPTAQAVARGIRGALDDTIAGVQKLNNYLLEARKRFGAMVPSATIENLTRVGAKLALAAPVIAAAGLAAKALGFAFSGTLGPALKSVATLLAGPVGAAIAGATVFFIVFKNEVLDFGRGLLSEVVPAISTLQFSWAGAITFMRGVWNGFVESFRSAVNVFGIDWKGLGETIGAILSPIIRLVKPIAEWLGGWGPAIGKAMGVAFMVLTPIGKIYAGALLIIKTFQVLVTPVVAFAKAIVSAAQSAGQWIGQHIITPLGGVWEKFTGIMRAAYNFGALVVRIAVRVGAVIVDKVVGALSSTWDWIKGKLAPAFEFLREVASTVLSAVGGFIQTWLITPLSSAYSWLTEKLAGAWSTFASAGQSAISVIGAALSGLGNAIQLALLEPMKLVVRGVIQLADALKVDVPASLRQFATGVAQAGFGAAAVRAAGGVPMPFREQAEAFELPAAPGAAPRGLAAMGLKTSRQLAKEQGSYVERGLKSGLGAVGAGMSKMADAMKEDPCVKTSVQVDGREIARATSLVKRETLERAGAQTTPWQHRMMVEQGATTLAR